MYKLFFDFGLKEHKKIQLLKDSNVIDETIFVGDDATGVVDILLKKNSLSINDVEIADFNQDGESFTGLRISAAIVNTINLFKGKLNNYQDIKLPKYRSEPHLTWSEKNL